MIQIKEIWLDRKEDILSTSEDILTYLEQTTINSLSSYDPEELFIRAFDELKDQFDENNGGFGSAPKFPSSHRLMFLLRYWKRTGDNKALEMVEKTLKEMKLGGMYDHIGFGFHRYSTDNKWLVPHFEKMLYDQAMLAIIYTEVFQATKKEEYKKTAEEIFTYILRDMTHSDGGFYSAEDADSEGEEGKFYTWEYSEIIKILGNEDGQLFANIYNINKKGNFHDEATGKPIPRNIPYKSKSLSEHFSTEFLNFEANRFENLRLKLFEEREKRIHPLKDDKVLTDWNGLMIAALAKASRVFNNQKYVEKAKQAANFIFSNLVDENNNLLHRFRDGDSAIFGNLDDYSFLIWGLLELYETTFDYEYLKQAIELNEKAISKFWDEAAGGFFFTTQEQNDLLIREKQIYDGAIPSGNSVALLNLIRLGRILSDTDYEHKADLLVQNFASKVQRIPFAYTFLLVGLDFIKGPSFEIVVVGDDNKKETKEILRKIREIYLPNKVVILKNPNEEGIDKIIQLLVNYSEKNEKPTIYVCREYVCKQPTNDVQEMIKLLEDIEIE